MPKRKTKPKSKNDNIDLVRKRLERNNIPYEQIKPHQFILTARNGEKFSYNTNGIIKSNYFKETGLETAIKYALGEINLTLKDLSFDVKPKHNQQLRFYMTKEALERKSKITDWLYQHKIPYNSHDAIITVARKGNQLPYESYDKLFTYNVITNIITDENDYQILPKAPNTLFEIMLGTGNYSYVLPDNSVIGATFRNSPEYIETLKRTRMRDNYKCCICGKQEPNEILEVHHIRGYTENQNLRLDMNNLISVCPRCHKLLDQNDRDAILALVKIVKKENK